jgi:hypothetical protein
VVEMPGKKFKNLVLKMIDSFKENSKRQMNDVNKSIQEMHEKFQQLG